MAKNKNKPAKAAAIPEATVVEAVLAETVVATDGTVIEEGTEVLVDAEAVTAPEETVEEVEEVTEAPAVEAVDVSHNSSFLVWPTDPWGMTIELKAALIHIASRIQGATDKKELVDAVLEIGLGHIKAKFLVDAKVRQAAIDAVIAENEAKEAETVEAPAQTELF